MNVSEEVFCCKWLLGEAIAQWGYVEGQLLRIVLACVPIPERPAMAIAFHSIDNFRSKLKVCDNLVQHKFRKARAFQRWKQCLEAAARLSSKRNELAHGWHRLYVNNKSGERWAIIPLHHEDGQLVHIDGEKPPSNAICIRQIAGVRDEFHALTVRLCNAYELLCGHAAPYPESYEQVGRPPTIRSIESQMRAALGRRQRPLRAKPSSAAGHS